ncbi:MAG: DUF1700 domain-containing protein [Clostridia bacterium]|nr:DUF1700 domain-containing protein [Clostridia bacterium]
MTYKEWEKQLLKALKPLPKEERAAAVEYYREMYGDKLESGIAGEKILEEFGSPTVCAERILQENGVTLPKAKKEVSPWATWIGLFFLTVLIILPLYAVAFSVVIVFAAVTISGAAAALAGALYVVYSPFTAIGGAGFSFVIAHMGMGFAVAGVGILLFIAFVYLTKYSYKWTVKSLTLIYTRKVKA